MCLNSKFLNCFIHIGLNNIGPEGSKRISECLEKNSTLTNLDLSID